MSFQSTRPARGATEPVCLRLTSVLHFNPRAPRGARQNARDPVSLARGISIHAPREGRDRSSRQPTQRPQDFNPRAPRGARRHSQTKNKTIHHLFQSTRPARGATKRDIKFVAGPTISIHAPREGRDSLFNCKTVRLNKFQSTRPARGATDAAEDLSEAY